MTGLFGGAFDPPHNGHVALIRAARAHFPLEQVVVLVAERPGHRGVVLDAASRLALACAAFPGEDVRLDPYGRTVDLLRAESWNDPLFLVGADEFANFLDWKEPQEVLKRARLGVATRPGFPRERLEAVLAHLDGRDRVEFFAIEPLDVASRDIRTRVANGEPIDGLVPAEVAAAIEREGFYRAG